MEFNLKLQDSVSDILRTSATTSRVGGMRVAPERSRAHLCWGPLIFNEVAKSSGMLDSDGWELGHNEKELVIGDALSRKQPFASNLRFLTDIICQTQPDQGEDKTYNHPKY